MGGQQKMRKKTSFDHKHYISRKNATTKLGMPFSEFRQFCILKGIYPRNPPNRSRRDPQTYYYTKDIVAAMRDPVLQNFRRLHTFQRKITRATSRREFASAEVLRQSLRPSFNIDHVMLEKYPSFIDCLRDLDDALCLVTLYAAHNQASAVHLKKIDLCKQFVAEWKAFVAHTRALRKVFISQKGIYYQAEIMGEKITWLSPHQLSLAISSVVDYQVMNTFADLYETQVGFVLYKLYTGVGLQYPPVLDDLSDSSGEHISYLKLTSLNPEKVLPIKPLYKVKDEPPIFSWTLHDKNQKAKPKATPKEPLTYSVPEPNSAAAQQDRNSTAATDTASLVEQPQTIGSEPVISKVRSKRALFHGFKFFLNREVSFHVLEFVILAFGGQVSWDGEIAPYTRDDPTITHEVCDRPGMEKRVPGREYIQPQWVFDSANEKFPLPVQEYAPGKRLPPHLSPFDSEDNYKPKRRQELDELKRQWLESQQMLNADLVEPEEDTLTATGKRSAASRSGGEEPFKLPSTREERDLTRRVKMMLPYKKRRLLAKATSAQRQQNRAVERLQKRRQVVDKRKKAMEMNRRNQLAKNAQKSASNKNSKTKKSKSKRPTKPKSLTTITTTSSTTKTSS
ncbi:pescadillo-like protein [Pelomyxa schiedti]|nr:pescadillo-like protein [Pelomyxa schiedti]